LVHRDVSPQNILVSVDGVVKVTDFGVAKALGNQQESTMAGQVKGKVAYMAPEQARGGAVDRRSDVFALGIVLYEITTAVRPFAGTNELEVMRSLAAGRFDPPSAIVAGYPRELEAIVLQAMSMDPAQRYASADAVRLALEEWLARSGPVITEAHIAATVRERVGAHVGQRLERIRERTRVAGPDASTAPEPSSPFATPAPQEASSAFSQAPSAVSTVSHTSAPSAVSTVSHTSAPSAVSTVGPATAPSAISQFYPVVQTAPPPSAVGGGGAGAAKTAVLGVAIGIGLFAVLALGGGGFWMMRSRAKADTEVRASAQGTPAAPAPAPTPEPEVTVELLSPKSGVRLLVDGVVQPVGQLSFVRPKPGTSRTLTAKADGYKDRELRFDDKTEKLSVTLEKDTEAEDEVPAPAAADEKPTAAAPDPGARTPAKPEAATQDKPKPKGPTKVDIPDNPF
jgi:serine/threonine-protein kinase